MFFTAFGLCILKLFKLDKKVKKKKNFGPSLHNIFCKAIKQFNTHFFCHKLSIHSHGTGGLCL